MHTCHPLVSSSLSALVLLGVIQTARSRNPAPKPQTEVDRQFVQCSTAIALLHQDRGDDALTLLKSHAHTPLPLALETPLSNEISPETRVLQLGRELMHTAQRLEKRGQHSTAQRYVEQCQVLSRRVRMAARDEGADFIAHLLSQRAQRRD